MRGLRFGVVCSGILAALLGVPGGAAPPVGPGPQGQPADSDLARLMQLSANGVEPARSRSAGDWLARAREQIQAARSYRSWLIKRDYSMPHLEPRDFAYVEWQVEFAGPDRLHVRQVIHEKAPLGELIEERIRIGAQYFINPGKWMRADAQTAADNAELDRFLLLEKFSEVLRGKFAVLGTARSGDRPYVLLESDTARPGASPILSEFADAKCHTRLWIDAESGLLAKAELVFQGKDAGGEPLHKAFAQVFTDYNQPLSIDPPLLPTR